MDAIKKTHGIVTTAIRPVSRVRGVGRICQKLNRAFLQAGVAPIQTAKMRDGTHMLVDLRSQTEWHSFYTGCYDDVVIDLIITLLSRLEGGFLDVGGNIGMYAVRVAARLGARRRVVCFEPMPQNANRIRENVALNQVSHSVEVYELALSDSEREDELVLREDFESGSGTGNASLWISDNADRGFQRIAVPVTTLDNFAKTMSLKDFPVMKVDIEGHEDCFLRGAGKWLQSQRPIIFTEINRWFFQQKGSQLSKAFRGCMPEGYCLARLCSNMFSRSLKYFSVTDLDKSQYVPTVILYPAEHDLVLREAINAQ